MDVNLTVFDLTFINKVTNVFVNGLLPWKKRKESLSAFSRDIHHSYGYLTKESSLNVCVLSDFQTPRSLLRKRDAAEFVLTNFGMFGNWMKNSFECLKFLKPLLIRGEIQSKCSLNF